MKQAPQPSRRSPNPEVELAYAHLQAAAELLQRHEQDAIVETSLANAVDRLDQRWVFPAELQRTINAPKDLDATLRRSL